MKKTKTPCLDLYYESIETGRVKPVKGQTGLCIHKLPKFYLIEPTYIDLIDINQNGESGGWWGSGLPVFDKDRKTLFTPLRQNIVLLLACLNEEY